MNNIFSFIICSNSKLYFDECVRYINKLEIPEGCQIELIEVNDAKSMTAGYNEGMQVATGDIKIYLHQDVFIIYPKFLQSIREIFRSDGKIGMVGVVGSPKLSSDGVMWHTDRIGKLYGNDDDGFECIKGTKCISDAYAEYEYLINDGYYDIKAVDGLLIATVKDLPWREDIFDGWDFYDVSQSLEMLKAGYRVIVPNQKYPWVLHDDGILNLKNYDKYRQICMKEYKEFWE